MARMLTLTFLSLLAFMSCERNEPIPTSFFSVAGDAMTSPLSIKVTGLEPDAAYKIYLEVFWVDHLKYCSSADFFSDSIQTINNAGNHASRGSYTGVDADGLFWSATPCGAHSFDRLELTNTEYEALSHPVKLNFRVTETGMLPFSNKLVARRSVIVDLWAADRLDTGHGQATKHIILNGDVNNQKDRPFIILIGGSSPGFSSLPMAGQYADRGFDVASVAYFGVDGLPECLARIDVDLVSLDIDNIISSFAGGRNVAIVGNSRGGELVSLLTLDTPPESIVINNSHAHYMGAVAGKGCEEEGSSSAWMLRGQELPSITQDDLVDGEDLAEIVQATTRQSPALADDTRIRLKRLPNRVLVTGAEDDEVTGVWAARSLRDSLRQYSSSLTVEYFESRGVGHDTAGYGRVPISESDIRRFSRRQEALDYAQRRSIAQKKLIEVVLNFISDQNVD